MFGSKVLGVTALSLTLAAMAFGANRVGPVSQYGQLQAGKNSNGKGQIYGACKGVTSGNEVQVQGMSLFWSIAGNNEGEQFWNASTVNNLVRDQNIQLIRAPMGVDENWNNGKGNYGTNKDYHQKMMNEVVQAAIDNDIYVIIDYHSHNAIGSKSTAATFFEDMASKWGKYDNVIFEVFNEPLEGVSWSSIKSYAEDMLKIIRKYSDNLVVVGNRNWDQYPNDAASSPIDDKNVAYTFHFYAGSHSVSGEGANAVQAMNSGLPVFVSEWGTVNADGGGSVSGSSDGWLSWMNQHKLSGANWSVNTKSEGASYFSGSAWNYSESGKWVNENIFSKLPKSYTACSAGGNTPASSSSVASSSSKALPAGYTDYIDDFEDGDSLAYTGGVWYAYNDNENGAASSFGNATNKDGFKVVLPGSTAGNNTKYVAGLTGVKLNKGTYEYDPFVALGVKLNADESAYDLSSCNTISYKYKGAAHNFKAEDAGVKDYGYHQISKTASSSWTETSFVWDMLLQESWAEPVSLSKSRINKFTWEIKGTQPSLDYLYIDDVRCDGVAIKKVVATPASSSSIKSSASMSSSSAKSSSSVSSSSARSSSSVSSSSIASSSSASLEWVGNAQLSNASATGVDIGQSNGYSPDRVISKGVAVTAGETNVLTFKMKLSGSGPLNISTNIEGCSEKTSVNTSDVSVTCSFTPASDMSTLTLTIPGGTWQTVTVSDLSVSVKGTPVVTVFDNTSANSVQNIVAGQAIEPIIYHYANATKISVSGLPAGLKATNDESKKTFTISGTVDATLGTHDYDYVVAVTGVDNNAEVKGTIKVTRAPVVTTASVTGSNATQNVVAGNAIAPIVVSYANATKISVSGLPAGLKATNDETKKTFTISGTVDATLGTHDYDYVVAVTGVDNNAEVKGTIKVTRAPVVTTASVTGNNATQNVVAGNAIAPIVISYANATKISVSGLPAGLKATNDESKKTFTISGTVDATLGTHDYDYVVAVTGVDNNAEVKGTIKVTAVPPQSSSATESSSSVQPQSSSAQQPSSSSVLPLSSSAQQPSSSSVQPLSSSAQVSSSSEQASSSSVSSSSAQVSSSSVAVSSSSATESSSSVQLQSSSAQQPSSSSVQPLSSSAQVSSSSEQASSSSVSSSSAQVSSSSVAVSSSSATESSSSVQPQSSSAQQPSSSSVEQISSSSEESKQSSSSESLEGSSSSENSEVSSSSENIVTVKGDLNQSVRQNEPIAPVTISGVEAYNRLSYNIYWLTFTAVGDELTISGTTDRYFGVGNYSEEFTINGETYTFKLDVAAYSSASEEISSSSEASVESSSDAQVENSSSSMEPGSSSSIEPESSSSEEVTVVAAAASAAFKMGFAHNTLTLTSATSESFRIQVFDLMGHAVMSLQENISGSFDLNLGELNKGSYLVRVSSGSGVRTARLNVR